MERTTWTDTETVLDIIKEWSSLCDDELLDRVCWSVSGHRCSSYAVLFYPYIDDEKLKSRVNKSLLHLAENPLVPKWHECSGKAVYNCARLRLPETRDVIKRKLREIDNPAKYGNQDYIVFLNLSIADLNIKEATDFLVKMVNDEHVSDKLIKSAYGSLLIIDPQLASQKMFEPTLFLTKDKPHTEIMSLSDEELRTNVLSYLYDDMYASFKERFYNKINDSGLKEKVNKILLELIYDIKNGLGGRAIYICSVLQLENIRKRLIKMIKKSEDIFSSMEAAVNINEYSAYADYLYEINSAIGRLRIEEGKDFLIKQLAPLKRPTPTPITKEHYLYYLSAKSALEALKHIDFELATKYEADIDT